MRKQFNLLKQFGSVGKTQDATDLLAEDLVLVEQRVEPTRKAAQIIHKKLSACMQSQQGLDADKRTKKLPLMILSMSMAESLKDFDADSPTRRVLEMCCFMQTLLAKTLADFEVQLEKEVLEPLSKLSEEDLPEILKNKKQFAKLTTDWLNTRSRSQASSGPQAKQDGLREEMEEAWKRLESIKDQYSADLYHFATKEDEYASYFTRLLELQADYHQKSLCLLERNITELKDSHSPSAPLLRSFSKRVYGQPLISHLLDSGRQIASPIEECVHMLLCSGLREEGLFRLAAAASAVKALKAGLDSGSGNPSEFSPDPHAVAGALKSYLRELPEPLMTFELYDEWFKAAGEKELSVRLEKLREVLGKLPVENYNNLRYLVRFLARLSQQQAITKMSPSNIAIVLGPNLLWPKMEGEDVTFDMASASSVQVVSVIEPLIQYADSLFPGEVDFGVPDVKRSPDITSQCPQRLIQREDSFVTIALSPAYDSSSLSQNICDALLSRSVFTYDSVTPLHPRAAPAQTQDHPPVPSVAKTQAPSSAGPAQIQLPLVARTAAPAAPPKAKRGNLPPKPLTPQGKEPQKETDACNKPVSSRASCTQGALPTVQLPPTLQDQDGLGKKGLCKKPIMKAPNVPPPNPPQLINKHV